MHVCREHNDVATSFKVLSDSESNLAHSQFDAFYITMEGGDANGGGNTESPPHTTTSKKKGKSKGKLPVANAVTGHLQCGAFSSGIKRCTNNVPDGPKKHYEKLVAEAGNDTAKLASIKPPVCEHHFKELMQNGSIKLIGGKTRSFIKRDKHANAVEQIAPSAGGASMLTEVDFEAAVQAAMIKAMSAPLPSMNPTPKSAGLVPSAPIVAPVQPQTSSAGASLSFMDMLAKHCHERGLATAASASQSQ